MSTPDIDSLDSSIQNLSLSENTQEDPFKDIRKLKSLDLAGFAEYMKSCSNIIIMNGAGISTSVGIPDFRSPGTGLYDNLQKYNLPTPQSIFELDYFVKNPEPFFTLSRELMPSNFKPSITHYFQKLLVKKNMVRKIYTQNIDNLELMAGISNDKIIHAHGSFRTGHCLECGAEYSMKWMKDKLDIESILYCEKEECSGGLVKPDIVFFGECLPTEFLNFRQDFSECDCLIVMGTSLKVAPFSRLPLAVKIDCPKLLINRDLVGEWERYVVDQDKNYRFVAELNECDAACLKLAKLLGLDKELNELCEK
ncbi:NAD-dependent deacetylase sirtuin-2 isoform X1 [Brachionus plicatilis]|uniref:NAD-dependent protein deacetylase n=1 Tax=Brachionus plicatilis TaxID=10195 RepID=A0A3M7RSK4_BRAPC|nr:NAD-dependent deacetylase sirtuin-2 isoform X1 [Brachionus plicatilis]